MTPKIKQCHKFPHTLLSVKHIQVQLLGQAFLIVSLLIINFSARLLLFTL